MFHYIDDLITLGRPLTSECAENNAIMHETSITFTGIEIDSEAMKLRLPQEKLARRADSLAREKGLQEAGTALADWITVSRLQGSQSRKNIPAVTS